MKQINWKALWAWLAGFMAGPIAVYMPYIAQFDFSHIPNEAHGSALVSVLMGLGLVNSKRPGDHQDDPPARPE